jgi:D-alanyl-D-alanine dipeptidase
LRAAAAANKQGFRFVLTDCLRTTDAQARMADTKIVQANPHWRDVLLSSPGKGAHPRAMAVDILLEDRNGDVIDMGVPLDYFSTDPNDNPAARDYPFPPRIQANRKLLEGLMVSSAQELGHEILPLPSEWWDFRFPPSVYEQYAPLSDSDLPPEMKMCA